MRKKGISLLVLLLTLMFLASACGSPKTTPEPEKTSSRSATAGTLLLDSAKQIEIKESLLSFGKKYKLYVGGKYAGEVTGKLIHLFGDVFTLKDKDGHVLATEKQIKRWHIKFNRSAAVMDPTGKVTGYIGEETFTKIFSIGYYFHFFDQNRKEIGTSDQVNFAIFKKNIFMNADDTTAYIVNKQFTLFSDSYKMKIMDKSKIPLYQAIFMVCIEDAIKDAADKAKSKSKSKKH